VHQVGDQTRSRILCLTTVSESRAAYEIMCETDGNITWRMRAACRITKATDINSEYVILIVFPRQQWLRERAPMSHFLSCRINIFSRLKYAENKHRNRATHISYQ
jgi:hypothetical protein